MGPFVDLSVWLGDGVALAINPTSAKVMMSDLIRRKSGYNTNAFYDRIQHKAENTVQVFISPYFTTSLNISSSRRVTQGDMSINMYAFTGGCAMFL